MKEKIYLSLIVLLSTVFALRLTTLALAETDGPTRQALEKCHFSEWLIKTALYPKTTHDVFVPELRRFTHGLKRVNLPFIYEPDVMTWEMAMAHHRKTITNTSHPTEAPLPEITAPFPVAPEPIIASSPSEVQLTPLGEQSYAEKPLYANADQTMNKILQRARSKGIGLQNTLKAESLKQQLLEHMKSLESSNSTSQILPAEAPPNGLPQMSPTRPQSMPRGKAADSFDRNYY